MDLPGLEHLEQLEHLSVNDSTGPEPLTLELADAQSGEWRVTFDSELAESPTPDASSFTFRTDQSGAANVTSAETLAGQGAPRVLRVFVDATPANPTGGVLRYDGKGGLKSADGALAESFTTRQS